tara:strand:- start:436 stop:768 length:333 start_codon:yes stop_codon:yes gene_type:complete
MDITLIAIAFFILLALVFLVIFLFKSINKDKFKADDGSVFDSKSDLDQYNAIYDKTRPLFSVVDNDDSTQSILGFDKFFLTKLTKDGFPDLKTLIKFRGQIKILSDLINN